jgi:hypothetical protein
MSVIVEVGAHLGAETFNFLGDAEALVYAFEPEQRSFAELYRKAQSYPRLTVLPFAVDIGDNQEPLFHRESGFSTLDPPAFGSQSAQFTMTWTIRLDTFMTLYNIEKIDYLRIDAPLREEMCLESIDTRIKDVQRGRIRRYGPRSVVPAWLLDHGFHLELDTTSDNVTDPDIRFWRT